MSLNHRLNHLPVALGENEAIPAIDHRDRAQLGQVKLN